MSKLSELANKLGALDEQLTKAKDEILAKLDELQTALADMDIPADAQAILDNLGTLAQTLDDIVPDPAPAPEEPVAP
jgi:hypothetical protein